MTQRKEELEDLMNRSLGSEPGNADALLELSGELTHDILEPNIKSDKTLDILTSDTPNLTLVIEQYWADIQNEVKDHPILKLYVATLYKLAGEYTRLENQMDTMGQSIEALGVQAALTNERARIRDNITSMTMEGWKLLNAVLDSLHKIQLTLNKMNTKDNVDPFEAFTTNS